MEWDVVVCVSRRGEYLVPRLRTSPVDLTGRHVLPRASHTSVVPPPHTRVSPVEEEVGTRGPEGLEKE